MSPINSRRPPDHFPIRIEGFEPSWAGPHPFDDGFCFGSEDGQVVFTDENGKITDPPRDLAASREAINGIAGFDNWLAVSTRQEVAICTLPAHDGENAVITTYPRGAHGLLVSSNHHFVAALGHAGVMMVKPSDGLQTSLRAYSIDDGSVNIYQLCEIPTADNHGLFVAACRSNGVGLIDYSSTRQELGFQQVVFPTIDVVDVVAIGTPAYPHAVVAVGMGGEVLLFRDIVKREDPISLKYDHFKGRTYRILSSCGHLFVLTSKAIYVLGNLAQRLTQESLGHENAPVMTLPMQAIDANICGNRWLLAIMSGEVHRYDVHQIHDLIAEFAANGTGGASGALPPRSRPDDCQIVMKPIPVH
jgi:hypothetical protein